MRPETIRASVHEDAMDKVTSFFNATVRDMVREMFQNARRAGARTIDVTTAGDGIVIVDDGAGIADPAALLAFGHSAWEGREHESPAGMGMYSLAGTTARIESRTADQATGWRVRLEPHHYRGEAEAAIEDAGAECPVGTRIAIRTNESGKEDAVRAAARHLPVDVRLNGVRTAQEPFEKRKKTVAAVRSEDLTILVREEPTEYAEGGYHRVADHQVTRIRSAINFHGHVVNEGTLRIPAALGINRSWYVEFDVHRCPRLKLVLPARKETVHDAFVDELRERAERAIFETLDAMTPAPELPYSTWRRGSDVLGRDLNRAPVRLAVWEPSTAENWRDIDDSRERKYKHAGDGGTIVPRETEGPIQVLVDHAATRDGTTAELCLLEEDDRYRRFPEYEQLRRLDELRVHVTRDGVRSTVKPGNERNANAVVDAIELEIVTADRRGKSRSSVTVRSDIGFRNLRAGSHADCIGFLLTREQSAAPEAAWRAMTGFYVEDDGADESDATQREQFEEAISLEIESLILTPEENATRRVRRALDTAVGHLLAEGKAVTIRYTPHSGCEISGLEPRQA